MLLDKKQLYRNLYQEQRSEKQAFKNILQSCMMQINNLSKNNTYCTIFEVPSGILMNGWLKIDVDRCLEYLVEELKAYPYIRAKILHPHFLVLDWRIKKS